MNKILRGLAWGVGIAVVAVIVTIVGIVGFVDPNDFKQDITQAVQDATGRELQLTGDIELSLFPWLGLSLGAAQLSNAAGFEDKVFARVESVDIKAKLLPLLKQRIEMKTVNLRGLQVNLSRAKDGQNNWDDLIASPGKESPRHQPRTSTDDSAAQPLAALAIGGVNVEGAHIRWDDRQTGQRIEVEKFNLRTGPIASREPIDIQLSTQLSVSEPKLKAAVKLQAQLSFDAEAQRYGADGLDISLSLVSDALPVSPLDARIAGNVDADIAQQTLQLDDVKLQALNLSTRAKLSVAQFLTTPKIEGQLSLDTFSPRDVLKVLGIALPETADSKVLNKAEIQLAFTGSTDAMSVDKLALLLDDSKVTGNASVKNIEAPAIRFDLKLDGIDVDRYLPPAAKAVPPSPTGAVATSAQLPFDVLRGLDVRGRLRADKFKVSNIRSTDLELRLSANNGQIRLSPVRANLYQGQYSGDIMLDVRKDTPKLSANEKLAAVHIGPLLKDMLGDDKASGTVTLAAKISANGVTPEAITKSVSGTANFRLSDGAVKGVNLGQMIREAYAKLKKKPAPPKSSNATDFAELSASVNIRNGVVHNQDLQAKSPLLRVTGKGQVDLPKQRINYLLNTSIVETDQGQAGKALAELKSLTIPVKVTGSFDKPKFALDLGPVLKAKAREELKRQKTKVKKQAKKKIEKKKDELKKKLEEKLKDKFKGLF